MKTGDAVTFLKSHREKGDIQEKQIHLTDEQVSAITYLAKDQGQSFEDMAMILIQYQMQFIEVQHQEEIREQARRN